MPIRSKLMLIVMAVFVLSAVASVGIARIAILPRFEELEQEEVQKNIDRSVEAIEREAQLLAPSASDWSIWDDMYEVAQKPDREFAAEYFTIGSIEGLRVDHVAVYDRKGRLLWAGDRTPEGSESAPTEGFGRKVLAENDPLHCSDAMPERVGLYEHAGQILIVVSHTILQSSGEGPSMGTVVMARLLDDAAVARIARQTRLDIVSVPLGAAPASALAATEGGTLPHSRATLEKGPEVIDAFASFGDPSGKPILRLRVRTPRLISQRGEGAVRIATASLLGSGALVMAVLLGMLSRVVVRPLSTLTAHVTALGANPGMRRRLDLDRRDEIGVLAREFDQMVERLAEARRGLMEQSYRSGIAEMASGVLHNIGNAITPLRVRVQTLIAELKDTPHADLQQALDELRAGSVAEDRARDLEEFVALAGRALAESAEKLPDQLAVIDRQIDHVQQILGDQEKFSRASRATEPLSVHELIGHAFDLISASRESRPRVELDASVREVGRVLASRVAIEQVFGNLIVNAAEAIEAAGLPPGDGLIGVTAALEREDGRRVVHVRVSDNGVGVPEENLRRVFERGFSTKSRASSGIGLHWSAVTINALSGRLFAESEGPGRGACFHVVLPAETASGAPEEIS